MVSYFTQSIRKIFKNTQTLYTSAFSKLVFRKLFNIALNNSPSYFKNKRWILETREFRFVEGSWEFICPGQEKLLLTLLCLSLKTTDQDSQKSRMILGFLTWRVLIAHLKKKKKHCTSNTEN